MNTHDSNEAKRLFNEAVEYSNGENGKPFDKKKALQLYQEAIAKGSVAALNNVAVMYMNGVEGLEKNEVRARELLIQAANKGDGCGAWNAYKCLSNGWGGPVDKRGALECLKLAVKAHHAVACRTLGKMYEFGNCDYSVERDLDEAYSVYLKGYLCANDPECAYRHALLYLYFKLEVKTKDREEHIRNAERKMTVQGLMLAAKSGIADGMYELSRAYERGYWLKEDKSKAEEWLQKASEAGSGMALLILGERYESSDVGKAMYYFRQAAANGSSVASARLEYLKHKVEERNIPELEHKAQAGDAESQYRLALRCMAGNGVRRSMSRAVSLFEAAASRGHKDAMAELGWCYLEGKGVSCPSNNKAFKCFASAVGRTFFPIGMKLNKRGVEGLRKCYKEGRGVAQDWDRARSADLWLAANDD